ncbi:hypothetical protein A2125_02715 [Candidatus Woesebacteria bacterium GWB1_43_5]|uniref:Sortase n=1 Tax=Candidatus Woesebacteria bacterium GWB1_43_5 TaxID=1802474 RepID=A0A1F7WRY7_9BACT|nr:MAG: hypothetical protein A2125_02715 [Candidatus Woesebacteria bacterium GWB1_43_5]
MFPRGIIYKSGYPSYGEAKLRPATRQRLFYQLFRGIGAGLIAYAVIFFMFTYAPLIKQEINFTLGRSSITGAEILEKANAQSVVEVQEEAKKYGVNSYFSVVIPKIGAAQNIIANVDASDEKSYLSALEDGVAHAKGTYFPGQGRRIYLFSHSTDSPLNFARYNAVFYLLSKLDKGDKIVIFFADKKYLYEVKGKKVVSADDTSWLSSSDPGSELGEELILQTCDPPGTTWRRLIVLAKLIDAYGGN